MQLRTKLKTLVIVVSNFKENTKCSICHINHTYYLSRLGIGMLVRFSTYLYGRFDRTKNQKNIFI